MIDKTTAGYSAVPDEVEAVLHNLCGYHLSERDPLLRYEALTREQVLYDALVSSIRRERGRAVAEIVAAGHKINQVAEMTRLGTRQRVQRLISIAKAAEEAAGEAAVAAAAAAAEAEVLRGLGAAVISSVRGLTAEGFGGEPYAGTAAEPEVAYEIPTYETPGYETPGYEAASYDGVGYDGVGYDGVGYDGVGYDGAAGYQDAPGYDGVGGYQGEAAEYAGRPVPPPRADRSRFDSELIPQYDADPRFARAHDDEEEFDPDAVLEPTMMMPTIVEPTREVTPAGDTSWWRRGRDSTARSA